MSVGHRLYMRVCNTTNPAASVVSGVVVGHFGEREADSRLFVHEAADAALRRFGEGLKADLEAVYCGVGGKLGVEQADVLLHDGLQGIGIEAGLVQGVHVGNYQGYDLGVTLKYY